jgi:Cu/Ag efflux pump CusA
MLNSVIQTCLRSRLIVVVVALVLMGFGIARLRHMPVDILPEFSLPYVEIQTESLGLSAEEVEQLITLGMEQDLLNGVPWLRTIRSESVPGLSSVVLVFEPGTNIMKARQMVSERMTQAVALPHVSKPPAMLQPLSATSRVLIVGLSSKTLTPIQMSVLARWTITPRLMGVPGVANVAIWGQRDRQLQVQVDPNRLAKAGVTLTRVLETAGNALWVSSLSFIEASTPGTGGFIDTENQRVGIRHILPIVSSTGLSQVPIEGSETRLGDVANVVEDHQPLIGDALMKGGPGLLLVIEKFPGANTLEVTRGVEAAFAELRPGLPGIDVDSSVFRPAAFIEAAVRNLGLVTLLGLLLVALILLAFFFDWRATFVALVGLPVAFVAAGFMLYLSGATINTIALTGLLIAIGVVVSHTVVDVDNIVQRLRRARAEDRPETPAKVVSEALLETRSAMIYAALIMVLAISPILFVEGTSGAFYRPMAIAFGLAVLAAVLVSVTLTPALALLLLGRNDADHRASPIVTGLQGLYESLLGGFVRRGRVAFAVLGVLTVVGLLLVPSLNESLLPWFKERDLLINLACMPGTSQPEMSRIVGRVADELRSLPGIRSVGAHIGRAVRGDEIVNVNSATVLVSMDPSANYNRTADAIQEVVDGYPGLAHSVRTYLREKSSDVVPQPDDEVTVRVYGDEADVLRKEAGAVTAAITGIKGINETHIKFPVNQATLETEVDLAAAQRHGLKPGDVRRAAATLMSGIQVGSLFEEQKVFDVVVWSTPETRHSLASINDLLIDTPGGGHVRLGEVAKVRIVPTASVIRHEAVKRYIDVAVGVDPRSRDAIAAEIDQRLRQIPFAMEYHAAVLHGQGTPAVVQSRIVFFGIAAAIGIYFLLQAALGSWLLAALALWTMSAAPVGGLVIAALTGNTITLGTLAGVLAVFGVAASSTITLMKRYQRLERKEREPFAAGLAVRGAREQLPQILLGILATALALAPALFMGDIPGLEIARPMALVLLGGLVTTVLLTLFLLPALFLALGVSSLRELDPFELPDEVRGGTAGSLRVASAISRTEGI